MTDYKVGPDTMCDVSDMLHELQRCWSHSLPWTDVFVSVTSNVFDDREDTSNDDIFVIVYHQLIMFLLSMTIDKVIIMRHRMMFLSMALTMMRCFWYPWAWIKWFHVVEHIVRLRRWQDVEVNSCSAVDLTRRDCSDVWPLYQVVKVDMTRSDRNKHLNWIISCSHAYTVACATGLVWPNYTLAQNMYSLSCTGWAQIEFLDFRILFFWSK